MSAVVSATGPMLPVLFIGAHAFAPPVTDEAAWRSAAWAYLDAVFAGAPGEVVCQRAHDLWTARERLSNQ